MREIVEGLNQQTRDVRLLRAFAALAPAGAHHGRHDQQGHRDRTDPREQPAPCVSGRSNRRGGRRLHRIRRRPPDEEGDVPTLRDGDLDRVLASRAEIVAFERPSEVARLHADDGIGLRIERGVAAEDLRGDGIGLDPLRATGERLFDHVGEEAAVTVGRDEVAAVEDAGELCPARVCVRRRSRAIPLAGACRHAPHHVPPIALRRGL